MQSHYFKEKKKTKNQFTLIKIKDTRDRKEKNNTHTHAPIAMLTTDEPIEELLQLKRQECEDTLNKTNETFQPGKQFIFSIELTIHLKIWLYFIQNYHKNNRPIKC